MLNRASWAGRKTTEGEEVTTDLRPEVCTAVHNQLASDLRQVI